MFGLLSQLGLQHGQMSCYCEDRRQCTVEYLTLQLYVSKCVKLEHYRLAFYACILRWLGDIYHIKMLAIKYMGVVIQYFL